MTPGSGVVPKSAGGIETARTGLRSKKEAALGGGGQNLTGRPESKAHENGAAAYATKNIRVDARHPEAHGIGASHLRGYFGQENAMPATTNT